MESFKKPVFFLLLLSTSLCDAKFSLECAKNYLKERNINEDALSFVGEYIGSKSECISTIKSELTVVTSALRSKISENRMQRPFVECIMQDIEEEEDESYDLKTIQKLSIEKISDWRIWSYFSRKSRLEELQNSLQRIEDKSLLKCQGHREFGDYFQNILEGSVSWNRSGEEDYCIRKELVNNKNMINPEFYNFRLNPRNVNTEGLDCDSIVKDLTNRSYKEIKTTECRLKTYQKNNYILNVLKVEVLSKLNLQKSDKSREKQDFINSMLKISYEAHKC